MAPSWSSQSDPPPATTAKDRQEEAARLLAQECSSDAFFQRSLPIMGALTFGHSAAHLARVIPAWMPFGFWGRTVFLLMAGQAAGNVSYMPVCRERFLKELPDSEVSKRILANRAKEGTQSDWRQQDRDETRQPLLQTVEPADQLLQEVNRTTYAQLREQHRAREGAKFGSSFGYVASGMGRAREEEDVSVLESIHQSTNRRLEAEEADDGKPSPLNMTYEQLRERHRKREIEKFNSSFGHFSGGMKNKQQGLKDGAKKDSDQVIETSSRKVVKNKYGDEVIADD